MDSSGCYGSVKVSDLHAVGVSGRFLAVKTRAANGLGGCTSSSTRNVLVACCGWKDPC